MAEHEDPRDEYSFMQETIKDEVDDRKKAKKDIVRMAGLGLVFGVIASVGFCVSKPWIEKHMGEDSTKVEIPKEETDTVQEEDEQSVQDGVQDLDGDTYRQLQSALTEIGNEASKSVVEITGVTNGQDWTKETYDTKNATSGLIVADNGKELLILGKTDVTKDANSIEVTFADGNSCAASLKKQEATLGLGIYAVDRQKIHDTTWSQIQTATLGSTSAVTKGDPVIVLGSPFGYADAMGFGTVASNKNVINKADGRYHLICTDIASADDGSGIIINVKGEVVGIIDQSVSEESSMNLVTAYGITDLKDIIEQLSNGQAIPYIGVYGVDVTADIEAQGIPKGVYVNEVETDSPAMAAGIQIGDIITELNGKSVETVAAYHSALMNLKSGERVKLSGKRQGNNGYVDVDFTVTTGEK